MTEHELRLGDRVKAEREKKGLSKKALAEMVGITLTYMDKIEKNQSMPSLAIMAEIARVLGRGVNYFLEEELGTVKLSKEEIDRELAKELSGRESPIKEIILKEDSKTKKAVLEFIRLLKL